MDPRGNNCHRRLQAGGNDNAMRFYGGANREKSRRAYKHLGSAFPGFRPSPEDILRQYQFAISMRCYGGTKSGKNRICQGVKPCSVVIPAQAGIQ